MSSVGIELPKEMARVRELLPIYDSIPSAHIVAGMMRQSLDAAAVALAEGDVIAIVRSYQELKEYSA